MNISLRFYNYIRYHLLGKHRGETETTGITIKKDLATNAKSFDPCNDLIFQATVSPCITSPILLADLIRHFCRKTLSLFGMV